MSISSKFTLFRLNLEYISFIKKQEAVTEDFVVQAFALYQSIKTTTNAKRQAELVKVKKWLKEASQKGFDEILQSFVEEEEAEVFQRIPRNEIFKVYLSCKGIRW